ncbi:MAG TPA: hypothetical protein VLB76_23025 [Thermoanaerobaculia bacterium]|nr:hypothetical protein [Thermoanaerobaculia bacterium]
MKKIRPPITVSFRGLEAQEPGQMSATRRVPASVPSVCQSSEPRIPSSATKKTVDPRMTLLSLG